MVAKIISFVSAKGGTGKTTTSASIAKFIAALGKRILLIDMDGSTNGLTLFFLEDLVRIKSSFADQEKDARGLFDINVSVEMPTPFSIGERIDLIPTTFEMKQTECCNDMNILDSLINTVIESIKDEYDYIIIDTQAGTNICTQIAIMNSNKIIIVSEYDPISFEGVERFKSLYSEYLPLNKTWILFNKILPDCYKSISDFLGVAKFLSPIPWNSEVVRALLHRELAINTEKGNDYTLAIMKAVEALLGDEVGFEIERWRKEKETILKEPIINQLDDINNSISSLEEVKIDVEYKLKRLEKKSLRSSFYVITFFIYTAYSIHLFQSKFGLFNSFNKIYLTEILTAFAGIAILVSVVYINCIGQNKYKKEQNDLARQSSIINDKLETLKERRSRYELLSDSDINLLINSDSILYRNK